MNTKLFAGAIVVAGLMTACGGELENQGGEQGDTGVTERAAVMDLATRGAYEPIKCEMSRYSRTYFVNGIKVVEECWIASPFTNAYRTGSTITFSAGQSMYINGDGLGSYGLIDGDQYLYTGTANGMVQFKGGTSITLTGAFGSAKVLTGGILAANTCLISGKDSLNAPIWKACAGGVNANFNSTTGYVSSCGVPTPTFSCP